MKTDPGEGRLEETKVGVVRGASDVDGFAGSLVELAKVGEGLDIIDRDLRLVKETVSGHMDLKKTLVDAGAEIEQKQAVIRELFHNKVSETTQHFLQMLVGLGRFEAVPEIAEAFARRLEAEENKVIAEVTTAAPIDAKFSRRLATKLSEMAGREVTIRSQVDSDLIGGIVVRIGGKLVDASVRNQLTRMREQMLTDMRGK